MLLYGTIFKSILAANTLRTISFVRVSCASVGEFWLGVVVTLGIMGIAGIAATNRVRKAAFPRRKGVFEYAPYYYYPLQ